MDDNEGGVQNKLRSQMLQHWRIKLELNKSMMMHWLASGKGNTKLGGSFSTCEAVRKPRRNRRIDVSVDASIGVVDLNA